VTEVPVVSIVGKSQSGKTLIMEQLIVEFKRRGYRVAALKHSRGGMEVDYPGKDSWRFTRAGSDAVLVSSPGRLAFIKSVEHEPEIEEIMRIIGPDFDVVLAEGFKKSKLPKIEVHREDFGDALVCPREELSAVITDRPLDIDLPLLAREDTGGIADFIEQTFVKQSSGGAAADSHSKRQDAEQP